MGGDVDQRAAVVDALDAYARRQHARGIDLVDFGQHTGQRRQSLRAAAHQHDALHDVVVVVLAGDAEARLVAHGHVATSDTNTGEPLGEASMVLLMSSIERIWPTERTIVRLRANVHRVGADVDVGVVQPVEHLLQREVVGEQAVEIDGDVIGLGLAAPAGDVDHGPGHRLEAALQHPVLDRLQIGHGVAGRPDHAVAEDLADRAGGRELRQHPVGQRRQLRQPVDDELRGLLVW